VTDVYPFRGEIEQILCDHPRTRYAKVLLGMRRVLTDDEMAQEARAAGESIRADSIASVRRTVGITLDGELMPARSDAEGQAGLYRELLNYPRSPELQQHIAARLAQLRAIDPSIKLTPLGNVNLGANDATRREKFEPPCPHCFEIHRGECLS
jgi:hypothetical protein